MSLRHAILGIIEFEPVHGYEIRRVLQEGISTFWPVNLAGIYPSLRRLEEEGLVTHRTQATHEGRPDRKVFEITESGRQEMARWRDLEPEGHTSWRNPLYLKLLFAREENLPAALSWIEKALETLRAEADATRTVLNDPAAFDSFFVRFMRESGLAHSELQLELLGELRAKIAAYLDSKADGSQDSGGGTAA